MNWNESQVRRIRETQQLRGAIEAFAARRLAEKAAREEADPQRLVKAFELLTDTAHRNDYDRFITADVAFHRTMIELADVTGLVEAWEIVQSRQAEFQSDTIRAHWPHLEVLAELHRPILEAVVAGDAAGAQQSVVSHLDVVWYRMADIGAGVLLRRDPVAAACAYLDLHIQQPLQLKDVAKNVCRTSTSHLARLFRQKLGMSFTAYLREIRLKRAAALLKSSTTNIREIANRVGYRDPSRFAQHFRVRYGVTPRNYRLDAKQTRRQASAP